MRGIIIFLDVYARTCYPDVQLGLIETEMDPIR
jgi:hypothetical protein